MGHYDTAQICKNGHITTGYYDEYPEWRKAFCDHCGAATVTTCDGCGKKIRGDYVSDMRLPGPEYFAPSYCPHCGKPYPWTVAKIQAAKELFEELEGIDANERLILGQSLDNLLTDTPKTEIAGLRFKMIMRKVGKESYDAVKTVLLDLVSEGVKRKLFGP